LQPDLFTPAGSARNRRLDEAVDNIRERFGTVAVARASSLHRTATSPKAERGRPDHSDPDPNRET
jgi:hypothetical protein